MRTACAAAALLLLCGARAGAEINVADSLEWMTVDARLIVRGKVLATKDSKGPGSVVYRDLVVRVDETLKGKVGPDEWVKVGDKFRGKYLGVRLRLFEGDQTGKDWQASGRPYLFFLRRAKAGEEKGLAGKVVPRAQTPLVIDLHTPKQVLTADMKVAKDPKKILAQVKKYAGRNSLKELGGVASVFTRERDYGFRRREVPFDSDVHGELYAGSVCYLNVPADE
jgi:hypothetical protein